MPRVLASAVEEIWTSANCAFKLCPMLTHSAIEALEQVGTPAQQQTYLPKLISGEWTGTMNLTEPQAGSDLAQVRTRAVPAGDHFKLFGQKIFITYGEHDFTPNIVHLVLARIDGAPGGVKGISLFLVPKFLPRKDGSPGERNDVSCLSIEHKLGIHASPTCVMAYGQKDGAIGYLVGEANAGLKHMFIMMNAARLAVGLEGYALAERSFQQAAEWARTRIQGRPPVAAADGPAPIIHHPDVKRMLLTMKSHTEAMRALALYAAYLLDLGERHPDETIAEGAAARAALLIPIVKGWSTDSGIDLTSLGIQVHGGMGYVEETGAAQPYRDVRISSIYEGTTGIQANDLLNRKLSRDQGAALNSLLAEATHELEAVQSNDEAVLGAKTAAIEALAYDAPLGGRRAAGDDECAGRCVRRLDPVPETLRFRVRWLAAGEIGGNRRAQACAGRRGSAVPRGQDRERALLRGSHPAADARAGARRGEGRGQRGRNRRRADLETPVNRRAQFPRAHVADEIRSHLVAHVPDRQLRIRIRTPERAAPTRVAVRPRIRSEERRRAVQHDACGPTHRHAQCQIHAIAPDSRHAIDRCR